MRLFESGSSMRRNNDNANVSSFNHGDIVIHELSLFHLTNSAQPVVGSSHGNSKYVMIKGTTHLLESNYYIILKILILWKQQKTKSRRPTEREREGKRKKEKKLEIYF